MRTSQIVQRYPKLQSHYGAEQRKLLILQNRLEKGIDNLDQLVKMNVINMGQALALKYKVVE